jgi:DNA-binding transcriptional LysR family regulator
VEQVFARLDETVRRVYLAHEGKVGTLRLGLSRGALVSRRVGRAIRAFRERYPNVVMLVTEYPVGTHAQALKTAELDAAIGLGDDSDPALSFVTLFNECVDSAMFAATHPFSASRDVLDPQQLMSEQFHVDSVTMPRFPTLRAALERLGFVWEELEGLDTVYAHVAAGNGWTPGMSVSDVDPPAGFVVRRIRGLDVPVPMKLRWRKSDDLPVVRNLAAITAGEDASGKATSSARVEDPQVATTERTDAMVSTRDIDMPQLAALVTALNHGSLSAAAEQLGLRQSTISRQIGSLARAVGVPLVARAGGRLLPTAAGVVLRDEAPAILELVESALDRARRTVEGMSGRCAIGSLPRELTAGVLVHALKQLTERYPDVTITVVESAYQKALLAGDIDLAIVGLYPGAVVDASIGSMVLQDDPLDCALIAAGHPLAERERLSPADLMSEPFLLHSRAFSPVTYDLLTRELLRRGLGANVETGHDGARAIWRAVASGGGWTLVPRSVCMAPPPGTVARPIEGLSVPWALGLQWRRDETDPVVTRVADVIRAQANPTAEDG